MAEGRDIRRCALQVLYQFDAHAVGVNEHSRESLLESLSDSPGDRKTHEDGLSLAQNAWNARQQADEAISGLARDWPIHRQPVIDRNILRLGYFEIVAGRTPPKVAINEAVELAREFSTEKSPAFINGILDKIMKRFLKERNHEDSNDGSAPR